MAYFQTLRGTLPKCTTPLATAEPPSQTQLTYPLYLSLQPAIRLAIAAITVVLCNGQNRDI
jgi:hypothetical protein